MESFYYLDRLIGQKLTTANIGFKLCPGDVNLVLFVLLITLVLGDSEVLLIRHNLNP